MNVYVHLHWKSMLHGGMFVLGYQGSCALALEVDATWWDVLSWAINVRVHLRGTLAWRMQQANNGKPPRRVSLRSTVAT